MSNHQPPALERQCDVAVVGGSAAGLAAALQLVRQRRSVIVIDAGEPRNAPAAHMHGYLGRDGQPPSELVTAGRDEVRSYGGEILAGRALDVVRGLDGRFRVQLAGGNAVAARCVVAATGIVDELPDIDGVAEHWGHDVIHCPFCHGYEARDQRIVTVVTHPMGLHPAVLFRHLTDRLTVVLHDADGVDRHELDLLRSGGVTVVDDRVHRLVEGDDGRIVAVELDGGQRLDADVVTVNPRFRPRAEAFASVGLALVSHPSGLGDVVQADRSGATNVAGIYAAGNVTDPSQQVVQAAANGALVGAMVSFSLAHEDLEAASRPSANEADWDWRYRGEQLWSGNPNGTLVDQARDLAPGRALDVGAGEGGDAIWLAEQGWQVTASDVSQRALDRVAAEADRRGLAVACRRADANAHYPFGGDAFDLVSAFYASIPRTPDRRATRNLLAAVAPGGTLLVVSHDLQAMHAAMESADHVRPFDPDAYVTVDEIANAVEVADGWEIEVHDTRPRPPGAASSHHVNDVILRARRLV